MSTIAEKKVRLGPAVMTLDMYGRLKINQVLAFDQARISKRAQAITQLRRAIDLQNKKSK